LALDFRWNGFLRRITGSSPPKRYINPLRASYRHLPETPSHDFLQKVKGYIDAFINTTGGIATSLKKSFLSGWSRGNL